MRRFAYLAFAVLVLASSVMAFDHSSAMAARAVNRPRAGLVHRATGSNTINIIRKILVLGGVAALGGGLAVWYLRRAETLGPSSVQGEIPRSRRARTGHDIVREPDRTTDEWSEQLTGSMINPLWARPGVGPKISARGAQQRQSKASSALAKSLIQEEPETDAWETENSLPASGLDPLNAKDGDAARERAVRGHDSAGFLPVDLYAHFTLIPGEKIVLSKPFAVPFFEEGVLGLTNLRMVAVVTRRSVSVFPPGIATEQRRHKAALTHITRYREIATPRPEFLIPALGVIWFWWPGTALAYTLGITAFAWPRRLLAIEIRNSHRRAYPLRVDEVREVLRRLGSLRADAMSELKRSRQLAKNARKDRSSNKD